MRQTKQTGTEYLAAQLHYVRKLIDQRDFAGAVKYYEDDRSNIERAGGRQAGKLLHLAATAYASLSDYPAALKTARVAQSVLATEGDTVILGELFLTLGGILRDSGEIREAEKAFRDAESIFRRNDRIEPQSRALNQLAGLFFRQQDYRNSLAALMDAVTLARELGDKKKLAFMTGNMGRIYSFTGNFAEARKYLQMNIDLSTELSDWTETARACLSLGYVYMQEGSFEKAEVAFDKAYPHIVATSNTRDEVIYLTYLGELRYRTNQFDEASQILKTALAKAEEIGAETTLTGRVLRHLAELSLRVEDFRRAHRHASKAMVIMKRAGDSTEQAALWKIMGCIAESRDDHKKGAKAFDQALRLASDAGVPFEKAEILVTAGLSKLFPTKRRLNFLFRAEEFYARNRIDHKLQQIEKLIADVAKVKPSSATEEETSAGTPTRDEFITASPAIRQFKSQLPAIARSDLPLLLTGPTGVGKDQMARHFHGLCRPGKPFVAVNCASVPETLLESELFGYRRGSFTGADCDRQGLFLAANGGVLYLDEIGDMPLALQAKLLGVLERRKVLPLGATTAVDLDVKLVVATNRNLEQMVEAGTFRRDLYYRISGISFEIPALRDRKEDIPLLLNHFVARSSVLDQGGKFPSELLARFIEYDWPGNTRELANKVMRLEVMAEMVTEGDLTELAHSIFAPETEAIERSLFEKVEEFERQLITEAMLAAGGNKSKAARILGVHEATIRTKLKRHQVSREGGVAGRQAS
ncbi:MAG: sigma 54-interacting transcriptional regulator [candidate division Zixibacteria bacterium]|nr:sigma 54-interacting transcriptional regulator [candidate division Zixibacteria bacterium]